METLLYFAFWGVLIFLMMRLGCGRHVMGHDGHGHGERRASADGASVTAANPRWVPPETDVDPVCGRTVETARAKSSVFGGWVYYFCSSECRERFEDGPATFLSEDAPHVPPRLEQSHG